MIFTIQPNNYAIDMKFLCSILRHCFYKKIIFIFIGNLACPVDSYLKYINKLNSEIQDLWQRALDSFFPEENTCFCKSPLGKNTLAKMMSRISLQGRLSQRYTNHSIHLPYNSSRRSRFVLFCC